jgi:hypothetical protein
MMLLPIANCQLSIWKTFGFPNDTAMQKKSAIGNRQLEIRSWIR